MRELAVLIFVSADGVMQGPANAAEDPSDGFTQGGWANPCWDDVMQSVGQNAMSEPYDLLLGRNTYDSFAADWGPGPKIEQAFEAKCGCDVNFVALDDGVSILNRLRLEGDNSKADIVLGLDNNLMAEAKQTGLLADHSVDTQAITLPNGWNDKTFVPYDFGYFAFVYNKEKLANPPKSLKELVELEVSDQELSNAAFRFPINTPDTKEAYFYRSMFEEHFPQDSAAECVPHGKSVACSTPEAIAWDASFANNADPSGRAVQSVHKEAY